MQYEEFADVPHDQLVDRAKGCLLGGAIGDALGAPVEFMSLDEIRSKYGSDGIQEFDLAYGVIGAITDDTQMTLFTAEGLIRARVRFEHRGICAPEGVVAYAYQRWLSTQGEKCHQFAITEGAQGWLVSVKGLHSRRAPGMTCLSSLRVWDQTNAKNDSKGCGTVMRSAPFGFVEAANEIAEKCAAITHGHPEARISAAMLASMIQDLVRGCVLGKALDNAICLYQRSRSASLLEHVITLLAPATPIEVAIRELGQGWTADEALAIAVYAALKSGGDFLTGIRIAVNHDGDSDSTGSICGNLIGAEYGMAALPNNLLAQLEMRGVIERVAEDLVIPTSELTSDDFWRRYPGC